MGLPLYLRRVGALYEALLREGIVQLREEAPFFRWASSCLSSIYLDFRRCLAYPTLRQALIEGLLAHLREGNPFFRAVAGVATGGISWAA
jgi:orotate phosphoribosyltransferase